MKTIKLDRKFAVLIAVLVLDCILVGAFLNLMLYFPQTGSIKAEGMEDPLEAWSEASYIIWQYNSTFYACRNMSTLLVESDWLGTNASTIINAVYGNMTSGGSLFIKAGTYAVNDLHPASNTYTFGEGTGTKLVYPNGRVDDQGHVGYESNNIFYVEYKTNVEIAYMELDGNQSAYAKYETAPAHNGNAVRFQTSTHCSVHDCYIHDVRRTGVLARGVYHAYGAIYVSVYNCYFYNCNWDAVEYADCTDADAHDLYITGTSDVNLGIWEGKRIEFYNIHGWASNRNLGSTDGHNIISFDGANAGYPTVDCTLRDSYFSNFDGEGILFLNGATNCHLTNVHFESISKSAVWSNNLNTHDNHIKDCDFKGCQNASSGLGIININGSPDVSRGWEIIGNMFDNSMYGGGNNCMAIYLQDCNDSIIADNHIENVNSRAIWLDDTHNTLISRNTVYNATYQSLRFSGSCKNITIVDNIITGGAYAFKIENTPTNWIVKNNIFGDTTFKDGTFPTATYFDGNLIGGKPMENWFSAANATATTFSITHGLVGMPDYVVSSFDTATVTGYTWTATSTTITITVTGTLPASITCYCYAKYVP